MQLIGRVGALVLMMASCLFAQAQGEVESLGFGGYYRPDCWVPMLVRLRPTADAPARLQIRVYQKDLDNDRVVTVREISLTPAVDGRSSDQWFWMYFRPQPQGLPDSGRGETLKNLADQLKVVLCDETGKAITPLPLTQMARRVDLENDRLAPARVVLCVSEGPHQPTWREYELRTGLTERPLFLITRLKDLPEDVRGYEMVDAIVWLNAQAPDARKGTEEPRYRAIEEFVRRGGNLVVCQGSETSLTRGFESILPVTDVTLESDRLLEPLMQMLRVTGRATNITQYPVAVAKARPRARVELEKLWARAEGDVRTPYLARLPLGFGCVTWVAQDLTDSAIARRLTVGWSHAWDQVMGWQNDPQLPPVADRTGAIGLQPYGSLEDRGAIGSVGEALLRGGSMTRTVSSYVLVAVGFFAVYWIIAGPGASTFLSVQKRSHLNWFVFGGVAVVAAVLSIGVTRLVQSQSVQLDHLSLVRLAPGMPAVVESRIGLYVPRDGVQRIELKETEARTVNWITPYPLHPDRGQSAAAQFLATKEYDVRVEDSAAGGEVALAVPYRSTQKRLDARWCGSLGARFEGKVTYSQGNSPELYGVLSNQTGQDLREVYLVYSAPSPYGGTRGDADRVIYIPQWRAKQTLELSRILDRENAKTIGRVGRLHSVPGQEGVVEGLIEPVHVMERQLRAREGWVDYWYELSGLAGASLYERRSINDSGKQFRFSLPVLSLFERVPPMRNELMEDGRYRPTRSDVVRLNGRSFDASSAVAAGQLLILAQAEDTPLPYPLTVEGERVTGKGVTVYQALLPLERK